MRQEFDINELLDDRRALLEENYMGDDLATEEEIGFLNAMHEKGYTLEIDPDNETVEVIINE